jgi:hypothetical protein
MIRTWLWKEWRDHRAVLRGILVALPLLTAAHVLVFGTHFRFAARAAGSWDVHATQAFVAVAIGIVAVAVASDLFAAEARHGTVGLLRRLRHGLGGAFIGKLLFYALACAVVALWQSCCLVLAWALNGHPRPISRTFEALVLHDDGLWLPVGAACAGLWIALGSTWTSRSAAAVGVGLLLLALAIAPLALLHRLHPWYFLDTPRNLMCLAAAAAALAVCATAWSFLGGMRVLRGAWSAAWRGALPVLVLVAAGSAYGARAVDAYLDFRPGDAGVRIAFGYMGEGDHLLYLMVLRQDETRTSPTRILVVDLADGSSRPLGRPGDVIQTVPGSHVEWRLAPQAALVAVRGPWWEPSVSAWVDARTGSVVGASPWDLRTPEIEDLVSRGLCASTPVRDAAGRRVWVEPVLPRSLSRIRREGESDLAPHDALVARPLFPVPGGWFGYASSPSRTAGAWRFVDATTRIETRCTVRGRLGTRTVLSPRHYVRFETATGLWWLGDVHRDVEVEAARPPPPGNPVGPASSTELWVVRDGRLVAWDPRTGADRPLTWIGEEPPPFAAARPWGSDARGRLLVGLAPDERRDGGRESWALLDPSGGIARVVAASLEEGSGGAYDPWVPIAIASDGSVYAIRFYGEVVRMRPGSTWQRVFPR